MRLGLMLGYWGLGLTAEDQRALVLEAEAAGLRLRLDRRGLRLGRRHAAGLVRRPDRAHQARRRDPADPRALAGDDRDDRRHDRPPLERALPARARARPGRRSPRAGTGSASASSWPERRSTWRSCARRWRASGSPTRARPTRCRCPTGPGKALKLMIAPVQERIPIYIAAIGPKNTQLVGEIADGWLPVFFSPEHVDALALAARRGRRAVRALARRRVRHRPHRPGRRSTTTSTARAT